MYIVTWREWGWRFKGCKRVVGCEGVVGDVMVIGGTSGVFMKFVELDIRGDDQVRSPLIAKRGGRFGLPSNPCIILYSM